MMSNTFAVSVILYWERSREVENLDLFLERGIIVESVDMDRYLGRGSTSSLAGSAMFGLDCDIEELSESDDTHLVWFGAKLVIRRDESR